MPDAALVLLCVVSLTDSSTTCRCANCSLDVEKAPGSQLLSQDSRVSEGQS